MKNKMNSLQNSLVAFQQKTDSLSPVQRRSPLIAEMQKLEGEKIHCLNCAGTCCTFTSNSMLITPLETLDILFGIKAHEMLAAEITQLKKTLEKTVFQFRLNIETYTGKKNQTALRKTYTCPFFKNTEKGCSLSRSIKPYGCLGFNPRMPYNKLCNSNISLLATRENLFFKDEEKINTEIKTNFNITWDKKNIPQALLYFLDKML